MHTRPNWENIHFWYRDLHDRDNSKARGHKARLKRCKTLASVYMQPVYIRLVRELGGNAITSPFLPVIASVLAHTECPKNYANSIQYPTLAKRMAQKKPRTARPVISPIRFKQLLACEDENELLRLLIRIAKQVEFFDIVNFAESLYYWNFKKGIKTKKSWAWDYYEELPEEFLKKGA